MTNFLGYLQGKQEQILDDLRQFVELETPTSDKMRLDDFATFLCAYATRMTGGTAEIVEAATGNHVVVRGGSGSQPPTLLIGHFDTVWPAGTISQMPFAIDGIAARGPGIFDMKCGLVQGFWAVAAFRGLQDRTPPFVFLCNADEETGSDTSRSLIEQECARCGAALVLEPSLDGALKTARKGAAYFHLTVKGRAAHAGADPFNGVSAIDELCRIVLNLHAQTNAKTGTTVNVGVIQGGTHSNVIAAEAHAEIDVRFATHDEESRISTIISNLSPANGGASISVVGGSHRPPMERTVGTQRLFKSAERLGAHLGLQLTEASTGGYSDGNLCAAAGLAVLDGLGPVGGGAHSDDEHVLTNAIAVRAALVAHLLQELGTSPISDDGVQTGAT